MTDKVSWRDARELRKRIEELEAALKTARNDALLEAADACTFVIDNYHALRPDRSTYEPSGIQLAAKGIAIVARSRILNLIKERKQ